MKRKVELKVTSRWDKNVVPAGEKRSRGLLIDIDAKVDQPKTKRGPINLALVIDRSGSMNGGRVEAAKRAAIGVVERLKKGDVLSIVEYDDRITVLADALKIGKRTREQAIGAIRRLEARGMTNLGGGWLEGATRAAKAMDRYDIKTGHVVLLSDGHANEGVTDPEELSKHADEMASRGVTTSTVGIGDSYSPLQLEALSEGGLGHLHDAASPEEIVETILGELGEVEAIAATDAELEIRIPSKLKPTLLSHFRSKQTREGLKVRLGHLISSVRKTVPLRFEVPRLALGKELDIEIRLTGRDPESGESIEDVVAKTMLIVVTAEESRETRRDYDVADTISRLWESTLSYEAMRINERGDYRGAARHIQHLGDALQAFSAGTVSEDSICNNIERVQRKVSARWDGRSKREAMTRARKFSKGERDHRSEDRGDWSDHV